MIDFQRKNCVLLSAVIVATALVISGCASVDPVRSPNIGMGNHETECSDYGWWFARFMIKWPENAEPAWHMDLFLSHKIISPVLDQYKNKIILWRFHRRAVRDQFGHQFSFIFYASPETATQIYNAFKSDSHLRAMKQSHAILQEIYDDTKSIGKPNIEDTSDPNWSPSIKKSWPYFIMGVSEMWLRLITEIANHASDEKTPSNVEEFHAFYQQINDTIKSSWQNEGRHALLHHLNAIFGYEPIVIYEKREIRF